MFLGFVGLLFKRDDFKKLELLDNYLRQGGYVCPSVCLFVNKLTQKPMDGF